MMDRRLLVLGLCDTLRFLCRSENRHCPQVLRHESRPTHPLVYRLIMGLSRMLPRGLHGAVIVMVSVVIPLVDAQPSAAVGTSRLQFEVRQFGATGTDLVNDTAAVQRAIDTCAAAGGGRVVVSPGPVITVGSVRLRSHVELHLERGAVLKGSPQHRDYTITIPYPMQLDPVEPVPRIGVMIFAEDAEDVAITGSGVIDGNGHAYVLEDTPHIYRCPQERPYTIVFKNCRHVTMRDVTVREAAFWTIRLFGSDDVLIDGIRILNDPKMPNNDGIDIDWSSNVRVANCHIVTGDDGISLHTSQPNEGINRPCENIIVTGCTITSHSAGLVVGADIDGIIRDAVFDSCIIKDSHRGVAVRNAMRGTVERISFSNMIIETRLYDSAWWGRAEPICVTVYPWTRRLAGGTVRDIRFSNLVCSGENGAVVCAYRPGALSGIHFDRITLAIDKTTAWDGGHQDFRPTYLEELPAIPVSGFILRNVNDVTFRDCRVIWGPHRPDYYRYALDAAGCTHLEAAGLTGESADPAHFPAAVIR